MNFRLFFCADGVLRAMFSEDKPLIPVKFLQDNGNHAGNELRFWGRWWESYVTFEEGLTVGKFLQCLEPWSDFWSDVTCKNVGEYIKESRRPLVIQQHDEEDKLDWVGLSYNIDAAPDIETHEDSQLNDISDINEWFNSPKKRRLTGEWEVYGSYKLSGFVQGKEESYCIDYTEMNQLSNLPLILNNKQIIHFNEHKYDRMLDEKVKLFADNAYGVCSLQEGKTRFLVGNKEHRMREVVEGFFWWLHASPARRDKELDFLKSRTQDTSFMVGGSEDDSSESESNVIDLFGKTDVEKESVEIEDGKKLKVKVADGAFSGLAEAYNADTEYWDCMLDLASQDNNVVVKIGATNPAKVIEKRVFKFIVDPNDKLANPQCSEFKES